MVARSCDVTGIWFAGGILTSGRFVWWANGEKNEMAALGDAIGGRRRFVGCPLAVVYERGVVVCRCGMVVVVEFSEKKREMHMFLTFECVFLYFVCVAHLTVCVCCVCKQCE